MNLPNPMKKRPHLRLARKFSRKTYVASRDCLIVAARPVDLCAIRPPRRRDASCLPPGGDSRKMENGPPLDKLNTRTA
jgi:hypothetical protein